MGRPNAACAGTECAGSEYKFHAEKAKVELSSSTQTRRLDLQINWRHIDANKESQLDS